MGSRHLWSFAVVISPGFYSMISPRKSFPLVIIVSSGLCLSLIQILMQIPWSTWSIAVNTTVTWYTEKWLLTQAQEDFVSLSAMLRRCPAINVLTFQNDWSLLRQTVNIRRDDFELYIFLLEFTSGVPLIYDVWLKYFGLELWLVDLTCSVLPNETYASTAVK